jgi:hypothetical protein
VARGTGTGSGDFSMLQSAETYRHRALECFAQATRAPDPSHGYILRGVGDSWLWLAKQAEQQQSEGRKFDS